MSFFGLNRSDLENLLTENNCSLRHVKTLMRSAYKDHSENPWQADQIPHKLSGFLKNYPANSLEIENLKESKYDHSVKFALKLKDGSLIESVLMPEQSRITVCLSSQVGCRQACSFCHTGRMGLIRNLQASEIIAQIATLNRWIMSNKEWLQRSKLPANKKITNVVFMGMGEPLDNFEQVDKSLDMMIDHYSFGLSAKRITVSTAGHLDGLKKLTSRQVKVGVAFSLHSTHSLRRSQLMPINRRFPMTDVLQHLKEYTQETKQKVLIQYTVISGVNDSIDEAKKLCELLDGVDAKLNLIPLNPIDVNQFQSPSAKSLSEFSKTTYENGLQTLIRFSKGQDIEAACGQLIKKPSAVSG